MILVSLTIAMNNIRSLSFSKIVLSGLALFLSFSVSAYSVPDEVSGVTANVNEQGKIMLEWEPGNSVEDVIIGYNIYYGTRSVQTVDDFYDDQVFVSAQTSYVFDTLDPQNVYYFAVTAIDSQENESATYSPEISFSADPDAKPAEEPEPLPEPVIEEPIIDPVDIDITDEPDVPVEEEPLFEAPGDVEAAPIEDHLPPLDASQVQVDASSIKSDNKIRLTWTKSINIDGDVQDQVLFLKKGHESWDGGRSLGKDLEAIELDVEPNQNYSVRIVTIDRSGNESRGATLTFSTHLAESGPQSFLLLFLAAGLFLFLFPLALKRR